MAKAAGDKLRKLLVAGRVDAGGLRHVSRDQVEAFARDHGFAEPFLLETSARENTGIAELKEAIAQTIPWDQLTRRSSPDLYRRMKEQIVDLRDERRALMRFKELRETLSLRMPDNFTDDELSTVVGLLTSPGVVWRLEFGSWILLQPEMINACAQAVIRAIGEDRNELGCIPQQRVLEAELPFPEDLERLPEEDERIVLQEMLRSLLERGLCYEQHYHSGAMLVFPAFARRERPDRPDHPSVMVTYRFEGFLDDIYATLVVGLHYASMFDIHALWSGAADFTSPTGKPMGVLLDRKASGQAELLVHFDPQIAADIIVTFCGYVDRHLRQKAKDHGVGVKRLRHWVCGNCKEPVQNREAAMRRLDRDGRGARIVCVECEKRVSLWDDLEERFADPDLREKVRQLELETDRALDNESKERALVGDVISTVALAGQIFREFSVNDHGIDGEVEFKDDQGKATGKRVYVQLKSGHSHLRLKKNGEWIFDFKEERWIDLWRKHPAPVMLIIKRESWESDHEPDRFERQRDPEIRWVDVQEAIREQIDGENPDAKSVRFDGKRFDAQSVLAWRRRSGV